MTLREQLVRLLIPGPVRQRFRAQRNWLRNHFQSGSIQRRIDDRRHLRELRRRDRSAASGIASPPFLRRCNEAMRTGLQMCGAVLWTLLYGLCHLAAAVITIATLLLYPLLLVVARSAATVAEKLYPEAKRSGAFPRCLRPRSSHVMNGETIDLVRLVSDTGDGSDVSRGVLKHVNDAPSRSGRDTLRIALGDTVPVGSGESSPSGDRARRLSEASSDYWSSPDRMRTRAKELEAKIVGADLEPSVLNAKDHTAKLFGEHTVDWLEQPTMVPSSRERDAACYYLAELLGTLEDFEGRLDLEPPDLLIPGNDEYGLFGWRLFKQEISTRGLPKQRQLSTQFAIDIGSWRLIGLDTGYHSLHVLILDRLLHVARWVTGRGYQRRPNSWRMPTTWLTKRTEAWLQALVADAPDQGLVLMTHHPPWMLGDDRGGSQRLLAQVEKALDGRDVVWFWGHEPHSLLFAGYTYTGTSRMYGRALGHGGGSEVLAPAGLADAMAHSGHPPAQFIDNTEGVATSRTSDRGRGGWVDLAFNGRELVVTHGYEHPKRQKPPAIEERFAVGPDSELIHFPPPKRHQDVGLWPLEEACTVRRRRDVALQHRAGVVAR